MPLSFQSLHMDPNLGLFMSLQMKIIYIRRILFWAVHACVRVSGMMY